MAKDDDLLPRRKVSAKPKRSSGGGGGTLTKPLRYLRGFAILVGGFVTLVGVMGLVGLATDNFWVRFLIALVLVVGAPALAADRLLKRAGAGGSLSLVADVFAVLLLGIALLLVAADVVTKPLLVREGDRYARSGSRAMASIVYFLGGVSPVYPEEKPGAKAAGSASASASAATSGGK